MAGAKLRTNEVTGIEVVKYPSRAEHQDDRWHVNVGEYDAGGVMYPLVSLFLSREIPQMRSRTHQFTRHRWKKPDGEGVLQVLNSRFLCFATTVALVNPAIKA